MGLFGKLRSVFRGGSSHLDTDALAIPSVIRTVRKALRDGDDASIDTILQRARAYGQDNPAYLSELGQELRALERYTEALTFFEQAQEVSPENLDLLFARATINIDCKRFEEAAILLDALIRQNQNYEGAGRLLSYCLRKLGRINDAVAVSEDCVKQTPNSYNYAELGLALTAANRTDEAHFALETAVAKCGTATPDLLHLVEVLRQAGRNEQADRVLSVCMFEAQTTEESILIAETLLKTLRYLDACSLLEQLGENAENNVGFLLTLARARHLTGNLRGARSALRQATALEPENELIQERLVLLEGELNVLQDGFLPHIEQQHAVSRTANRILHVLEMSLPHRRSGYTVRSQYVLEAQRAHGLDVIALTRPGFPEHARTERITETVHDIPFIRTPIAGSQHYAEHPLDGYLQTYAESVAQAVIRHEPDIIHATSNFKNALAAQAVAEAYGVPWVYELRGLWEETLVAKGVIEQGSELYELYRAIETRCLRDSDAVVTISETTADELVARGIPREKVFMVPNAVDTERFLPAERNQTLARSLGIESEHVIGYVSSLNAYEGIDTLVRAFAKVREEISSCQLLIAGTGEEYDKLLALSRSLGVADAVIFTGHIPHEDIPDVYNLLDLFVVPRRNDRVCNLVTPLKPFEALASECPLVVTDVKALREIVRDGEFGTIVPPDEPDALATVCCEILRDPTAAKTKARLARLWCGEHRTWAQVAREYRNAYAYANTPK